MLRKPHAQLTSCEVLFYKVCLGNTTAGVKHWILTSHFHLISGWLGDISILNHLWMETKNSHPGFHNQELSNMHAFNIFVWGRVTWASCQIRKIAGCACAGNAGNVFPRQRLQWKTLVSDSGMHHCTCVTHVPWCISGSLVPGGGENVPGILRRKRIRNFPHLSRGPFNEI